MLTLFIKELFNSKLKFFQNTDKTAAFCILIAICKVNTICENLLIREKF